MYFCSKTGNGKPDLSTINFSETFDFCICSDVDSDNAIFLDGILYNSREIGYWKALKTKENQTSAYTKSIAGLTVNGIKVKTTAESTTALNELLSLATLENNTKAPVEFRDYNDEWHSVTVEQFRVICLQVGQYCRAIDKSYTTSIKLIEQAKTIEEVQAIVI